MDTHKILSEAGLKQPEPTKEQQELEQLKQFEQLAWIQNPVTKRKLELIDKLILDLHNSVVACSLQEKDGLAAKHTCMEHIAGVIKSFLTNP